MAMSVVYTTFDGMLVHEDRGGVERQYVRDPLGNLIGELDQGQEQTYSADYWPYGEAHTVVGFQTSDWGFVGLLGYLRDLVHLFYVRARYYLSDQGRWLTADSVWPYQPPYSYANADPISLVDRTGLWCWPLQWISSICDIFMLARCTIGCGYTGQLGLCFKRPFTCYATCVCLGNPTNPSLRQLCSGHCYRECGHLADPMLTSCWADCFSKCMTMKSPIIPNPGFGPRRLSLAPCFQAIGRPA